MPRKRANLTCRHDGCENAVKESGFFYCSVRCQHAYQYQRYIAKWLAGDVDGTKAGGLSSHVRRYVLEMGGFRCSICGWGERNAHTGRVPLHVDHIDGDAENNRPENLRCLCPNHHALTATYAGANRGKGRAWRRARYLKGIRFSPLIYDFLESSVSR
jgi:HNH endonuclease